MSFPVLEGALSDASGGAQSGVDLSILPERTEQTWLTHRRCLAILGIFLALIFLGNALWLRMDNAPPAWDTARYLVNSLEAFDALEQPSLSSLQHLYFVRNTVRPSIGFVLPTALFYLLLGISQDTATLWTQFLFLTVIVLSTYGIGRQLFGEKVGLFAALLVGLNPEIIRLSRIFWPELGVVAVTSLGVYVLLRSDYLHRRAFVVLAGVVLGIGMMQRPIFPLLFLAGPLAFVFMGSLFVNRAASGETLAYRLRHRFLPGVLLFALPVLLIDLPFYWQYGQQMLNYVSGFQEAGTFAPVQNSTSLESLLWYSFNLHISVTRGFQLLFLAGLIIYVAMLILRRAPLASTILLAWIFVPYLVLSLTASKGFSYVVALYPALALVLAFAVLFVTQRNRVVQGVASMSLLALALLTYWQVTWDQPLPNDLARRLAIVSNPPSRVSWPTRDIVALIDRLAPQNVSVRVGVVSAIADLAEPPLAYYARLIAPEIQVIRWTDPLPTLLDAEFVVLKTGQVARNPQRTVEGRNAALVSQVLQESSSIFYATHQQVGQFDLPDGSQALIYRRQGAPRDDEARAIAQELIAVAGDGAQSEAILSAIAQANLQDQLQRGQQLYADQQYEEALAVFQNMVDVYPDAPNAQQDLARTMFALGDCDGAVEHQQIAAQLLPINGTFTVLGDILMECNRVDEAITAYRQAIRIDSKVVRSHFVLGQAYMARGNAKDAIAEFNTVIALDTSGEFSARAQSLIDQLRTQ